jgi:UDP-N-acetylglucosamine:LPS N-acetylglucosamine transferase
MFLSGSLGKGHDTLAEACAVALARRGVESRTIDCMAMLGQHAFQAVGDWVFRRMVSIPPIYDAFHFSQLRGDGRLGRAVDRAALSTMYRHLCAEMDDFQPDLVISVFATGVGASVRLQVDYPHIATAVFMTDSFAHRLWVHEGIDLFLVTSEVAAASVRRYWPQARVAVVNAPVRSSFYRVPAQAVIRAELGLPANASSVLLMSGAWGIGPLDEMARALADAGLWVLTVGGTNERLARRLAAVAANNRRVLVFGYTERIAELMAASDVIVTSSGDTCREARVIGRGLILLDVVPGHGRENLMHELELGAAAVCSATPASVLGAVQAFFADPPVTQVTSHDPDTAPAWDDEFLAALSRGRIRLEPEA